MAIVGDLSRHANGMYRIVSKDGERTSAEIAEVADLCAKAAKQSGEDGEYRQTVREANRIRTQHAEEIQLVLGSSDASKARLNTFLEKERGVLRLTGLEDELVEASLARGSEVAEQAREWPGDAEQFLGWVDQLRDDAKSLHKQLTQISEIEKALARASQQADTLKSDLEWAVTDSQAEQHALNRNKESAQRLAHEISVARRTNRELTIHLSHPGQHESQRRGWSIAWNLTFAIVGLVIVRANVIALHALGPADSAVSCTLGGAFTGSGIEALRHTLFGAR